MKSLRVKKNWVKDFNTAKSNLEELEILYEFFNPREVLWQDEVWKLATATRFCQFRIHWHHLGI